ncbi:MAG: hypothetical protein ACWA41_04910 [Putridiphycobacter sp.]
MKWFKLLILVVFVLSMSSAKADRFLELNPRKKYPFSIQANFLGPSGHAGLSISAYPASFLNLELGSGVFNANNTFINHHFFGAKYHFLGKSILRSTIYLGAFLIENNQFSQHSLYFPIGIEKIKKSQLVWRLELAFSPNRVYYNAYLWGSFKIGYQFRFKTKKTVLDQIKK